MPIDLYRSRGNSCVMRQPRERLWSRKRERKREKQMREGRGRQIFHARLGMRKAWPDEAQNELWKRGDGCTGRLMYRVGKGWEYDSPAISRCNNRLVRARNTWDRRERKRENLRYCFIQRDERISSKEAFLLVFFFFLFIAVRYLRRDISCLISGITIRNKRKIATSGILWYIRISNRVARSFTSLISTGYIGNDMFRARY